MSPNIVQQAFAARRRVPGWMLPMGWFALFGTMMPVMFGLNGWAKNAVFMWTGWVTFWMLGFFGTYAIGFDAARNLARFGFSGALRPRFYFEVSRLCIAMIFLMCAPALTVALLWPQVRLPFLMGTDFKFILECLVFAFSVAALAGYLVSFATGRPRRGRAYECASWFFCLGGGVCFISLGYILIDDGLWQGVSLCGLGIVLMICGIVAEMARTERENAAALRLLEGEA